MVFDGCSMRKELIVVKDGGIRTCTDRRASSGGFLPKKYVGKVKRRFGQGEIARGWSWIVAAVVWLSIEAAGCSMKRW